MSNNFYPLTLQTLEKLLLANLTAAEWRFWSYRIHLFGKQDLAKLALAQATCSEFGITVTFEEVQ